MISLISCIKDVVATEDDLKIAKVTLQTTQENNSATQQEAKASFQLEGLKFTVTQRPEDLFTCQTDEAARRLSALIKQFDAAGPADELKYMYLSLATPCHGNNPPAKYSANLYAAATSHGIVLASSPTIATVATSTTQTNPTTTPICTTQQQRTGITTVYIQYSDAPGQLEQAEALQQYFNATPGFIAPGIEHVGDKNSPDSAQVRYYKKSDLPIANTIACDVRIHCPLLTLFPMPKAEVVQLSVAIYANVPAGKIIEYYFPSSPGKT